LDRRLGGPQSRSGRGGEEKNFQPTPGIEPLNPARPARSPALYRLSYRGSGETNKKGKIYAGVEVGLDDDHILCYEDSVNETLAVARAFTICGKRK
jgi:hypothetical protein